VGEAVKWVEPSSGWSLPVGGASSGWSFQVSEAVKWVELSSRWSCQVGGADKYMQLLSDLNE